MSLFGQKHTGAHEAGIRAALNKPIHVPTHLKASKKKVRLLCILGAAVVLILCSTCFAFASLNKETVDTSTVSARSFTGTVTSQKVSLPKAAEVNLSKLNTDASFFLSQHSQGTCTLASVTMMLRRAMYIDGGKWRKVTQDSVAAKAWSDAGLSHSFTYKGYHVTAKSLDGSASAKAKALKKLLRSHPEGIVVYDMGVPHAVLLIGYSSKKGVFYCADPASEYSGKRIAVSKSWNGTNRGSQEAVIAGISLYWSIDK